MFEIIKSWQKAGWCSVSAILVFEKGRGGVEEEIVKSKDLSDLSERYITKIAANTIHQIGKRSGQMCSCGFSINNENFLETQKYKNQNIEIQNYINTNPNHQNSRQHNTPNLEKIRTNVQLWLFNK